ncbi:P-type conjugative transfer protein TrbJ [Pandoraea cepalis]|nr:P-type conjugative transfer protein TrbJ [Pandoraea cepalis]
MHNKLLKLIAITALAFNVTDAAHASGAVAGATEPTQLLNNLELLQANIQQAQQVANQLRNLTTLPQMVWGQAQADLQQLTGIVNVGQTISYAATNVDQVFRQQYPGYGKITNFPQSYAQWGTNTLDNLRSALNVAGLQSSQFASERAALQSIQSMANNPTGQLQAVQAGVSIASMQVDQLQKLRQLMMTQMQAQNTYLATKTQTEQAQAAAQRDHFEVYQPTASKFSSSGGSN